MDLIEFLFVHVGEGFAEYVARENESELVGRVDDLMNGGVIKLKLVQDFEKVAAEA